MVLKRLQLNERIHVFNTFVALEYLADLAPGPRIRPGERVDADVGQHRFESVDRFRPFFRLFLAEPHPQIVAKGAKQIILIAPVLHIREPDVPGCEDDVDVVAKRRPVPRGGRILYAPFAPPFVKHRRKFVPCSLLGESLLLALVLRALRLVLVEALLLLAQGLERVESLVSLDLLRGFVPLVPAGDFKVLQEFFKRGFAFILVGVHARRRVGIAGRARGALGR